MKTSITSAQRSLQLNSIDGLRPKPAKVELNSQPSSTRLTGAVKDGLLRHFGSMKAAAISMEMDEGQLSRELRSGDFKLEKLERLDEAAKATVAEELNDRFGVDPKAKAQRLIREGHRVLEELSAVVGVA